MVGCGLFGLKDDDQGAAHSPPADLERVPRVSRETSITRGLARGGKGPEIINYLFHFVARVGRAARRRQDGASGGRILDCNELACGLGQRTKRAPATCTSVCVERPRLGVCVLACSRPLQLARRAGDHLFILLAGPKGRPQLGPVGRHAPVGPRMRVERASVAASGDQVGTVCRSGESSGRSGEPAGDGKGGTEGAEQRWEKRRSPAGGGNGRTTGESALSGRAAAGRRKWRRAEISAGE